MTPPLCTLRNFTVVSPSGTRVLDGLNLDVNAGEIILLTGASGSGKSTLLNALADVLDGREWTILGDLLVPNGNQGLARQNHGIGAMVFQNFALFDDLTAAENIDIARDHAAAAYPARGESLSPLLNDIHPDLIVEHMSGGQKQRVAIARTLHAGQPILLFDEPNSGLDLANTQILSMRIKQLANDERRAVIIGAHHFQGFLTIVDRVWLLGDYGRIQELEPRATLIEKILTRSLDADLAKQPSRAQTEKKWLTRTASSARARWIPFFFMRYFQQLCSSPLLLSYMAIGGILTGFVSIWFTFQNLPYKRYLADIIHDDLLIGLGFFQFRVLAPLIAALLLAARNGAIISADIGHRVLTSQFKAMRNLHLPYKLYFGGAIIVNSILAGWLMFVVVWLVSAWVSLWTWKLLFSEQPIGFWRELFFDSLFPNLTVLPDGISWVLLKMAASGVASAVTALAAGFAVKASVLDINRGIAMAIVSGTSAVLLIHTALAFLEF